MIVYVVIAACFLFAPSDGAGTEFSYDDQANWPGVCVTGNTGRQSPIDILTDDVKDNSNLIELEFSSAWSSSINGVVRSGGHNIQFDPTNSSNPAVTTNIHLGTYRVLQMHMHWGGNNTVGSEHTVDGQAYPLELHFVHEKEGQPGAGDDLAVIGVFAEVVNTPIADDSVWDQLDAAAIQSYPSNISVTNLVYNNLLPPAGSRDYYHYVGSLTTPGCDEIVQWFVLKTPIQVPAAYLAFLRQVESANANETLTFNFRDVQPLGDRSVYRVAESGAPKTIVSSLSIVLAMFITITLYFSF